MSRVNINCLMIWKKDDIEEEITFNAVTPLITFKTKMRI